jgi:hypothetical protein
MAEADGWEEVPLTNGLMERNELELAEAFREADEEFF